MTASSSGSLMIADLDIMEKPPRSPTEGLVSPWTFVRWMVVGFYVGFATVAAFAFWYMFDNVLGVDLSQDGHSTVTWYQLTHYTQCSQWKGFQVSICSVHHTWPACPAQFTSPFAAHSIHLLVICHCCSRIICAYATCQTASVQLRLKALQSWMKIALQRLMSMQVS
jgi:magnesium-transporting ATPase (P-type)